MKRFWVLFLSLAMAGCLVLGLSACGSSSHNSASGSASLYVSDTVKSLADLDADGSSGEFSVEGESFEIAYDAASQDGDLIDMNEWDTVSRYMRGGKVFTRDRRENSEPCGRLEFARGASGDEGRIFGKTDAQLAPLGNMLILYLNEALGRSITSSYADADRQIAVWEFTDADPIGKLTGEVEIQRDTIEDALQMITLNLNHGSVSELSTLTMSEALRGNVSSSKIYHIMTAPYTMSQFRALLDAISKQNILCSNACKMILEKGDESKETPFEFLVSAFQALCPDPDARYTDLFEAFTGTELIGDDAKYTWANTISSAVYELIDTIYRATVGFNAEAFLLDRVNTEFAGTYDISTLRSDIGSYIYTFDGQGKLVKVGREIQFGMDLADSAGSMGWGTKEELEIADPSKPEAIGSMEADYIERYFPADETVSDIAIQDPNTQEQKYVSVTFRVDSGKLIGSDPFVLNNETVYFGFEYDGEYRKDLDTWAKGRYTIYHMNGEGIDRGNVSLSYSDVFRGYSDSTYGAQLDISFEPDDPEESLLMSDTITVLPIEEVVLRSGTVQDFLTKPLEEIPLHTSAPVGYSWFQSALEELLGQERFALRVSGREENYLTYDLSGDPRVLYTDSFRNSYWDYYFGQCQKILSLEYGICWVYAQDPQGRWKKANASENEKAYLENPLSVLAQVSRKDFAVSSVLGEDGKPLIDRGDGSLVYGFGFERNGMRYNVVFDSGERSDCFESIDLTCFDGESTVVYRYEQGYIDPQATELPFAETIDEAPMSETEWQAMLDLIRDTESVTLETVNGAMEPQGTVVRYDFANERFAEESQLYGETDYYYMENGALRLRYQRDGMLGCYDGEASEAKREEFYENAYRLLSIHEAKYTDLMYDACFGTYTYRKGNDTILFKAEQGKLVLIAVKEGERTPVYYKVSGHNDTDVTLPRISLETEELEKVVEDTFAAQSYRVEYVSDALGIKIDQRLDLANQIESSIVTSANGDPILNLYRAAENGKLYLYTDKSGAWLRAEMETDPVTFFRAQDAFAAFKEAWASAEHVWHFDVYTGYTFGNFVITVENGKIATLQDTESGVFCTFSGYGTVSLTLPALGQTDTAVREAFVNGILNTVQAKSFHGEYVTVLDKTMPALWTIDAAGGTASSVTAYLGATYPAVQIYAEYANGIEYSWARAADMSGGMPSEDPEWGNWEANPAVNVEEETHRTNLYFYHPASMLMGGRTDRAFADSLFPFASYDAATGMYTVRAYDFTSYTSVDYLFKIENGYVTQVVIKDRQLLETIGEEGDSLTIEYSNFNETTVTRPQVTAAAALPASLPRARRKLFA